MSRVPTAGPSRLAFILAGLCLGAAVLVLAPPAGAVCPSPNPAENPPNPFQATLKFQGAPANAVFSPSSPPKLVLQIQNCSGSEVLTTDGFSSTDFFRLLQFVTPGGRVINASGAPLHVVAKTFHCHSRKGPSGSSVLQSPTISVVPVEALASSFFREYLIDPSSFYDLRKPSLYSVTFNGEALTFDTNDPSAKFDDCEQFPGTTVVNVAAVTGRNSYSIVSNTLQFVIAGPGAAGPLDHIVISPATSSMASGGTEFYTAEGFDASNNSLGDVTSATTFTITPNGSCSGPTCTADTSGSHTVKGTLSTKTATATLTVAPVSNVVKVWVGLANSDDVGIRFDLKAIVTKNNGSQVGSGQLGSVSGGSSNFNNAILDKIPIFSAGGPVGVSAGDTLKVEVLVRNACSKSGKIGGTARLWFDGAPRDSGTTRDAGSRLSPPTEASTLYFLRSLFKLDTTPGSSRTFIDKPAGPKCAPYQSVGTWNLP